MVLGPTVHAEHDRSFAGHDVVQIDAVHDGALADVLGHCLSRELSLVENLGAYSLEAGVRRPNLVGGLRELEGNRR
jgi:hypothetical protein